MNLPRDCRVCTEQQNWSNIPCQYHHALWALHSGIGLPDLFEDYYYANLVRDVLRAWEKHPK